MLFVATFTVIVIAYAIYQWQDSGSPRKLAADRAPRRAPLTSRTTTQPGQPESVEGLSFRGGSILPGESPVVRLFDEQGNAKIILKSRQWHSISETAFRLTDPEARLLLPGGQLAYVWADKGEVELERNTYKPKRGWLRGNVRVYVDRSKPEWRDASPERADPEQHPEMLVKIWLDDVDYDLDLGHLQSAGPIKLESADGTIEGKGLELIWNEVSRQIRKLRIAEGKRATIRNAGMAGFGLGGAKQISTTAPAAGSPASPPMESERMASAMPEKKQSPRSAAHAPPQAGRQQKKSQKPRDLSRPDERLTFQNLSDDDRPKEDRIDRYQIEFHNNVVAKQKEGDKVAGSLKADVLQLIADMGREERAAVEHAPGTRPASDDKKTKPAANVPAAVAAAENSTTVEVVWTGELIATPISSTTKPAEQAEPKKADRVHLIATGSPVELFDQKEGTARCQKLEYHAETKRVWLTGTREAPVAMQAGPGRELFGEKVSFDRQLGIARVDGVGRMVDSRKRERELPACMNVAGEPPLPSDEPMAGTDTTWTGYMQIEFGMTPTDTASPGTADAAAKGSSVGYLRHAVIEGQVVMNQQGETIAADRIEARFMPPRKGAEPAGDAMASVAAESLLATGNVHMKREVERSAQRTQHSAPAVGDELSCDRLEVDMTLDDTGRNVPRLGRAFGNIIAHRVTADGRRDIRAKDKLVIELASVPKPITPEEQARFEAGARRCGYQPGSPQWQAFETRLRNRRKIVAKNISATGDVRVDTSGTGGSGGNLNLIAESLDCALREDEEITRALIVGRPDQPATVDLGEVYVKGPRISLDMSTQSMEVPGAGRMRFMTRQDLAGRPVDRAIPVVVNWDERMFLRGHENISTFIGKVRAVSADTTLDCRELRIDFEDLPKLAGTPVAAGLDQRWILKPILSTIKREKKQESPSARMAEQMRKRPAYLRASGDAVIVSADYAKPAPNEGTVEKFVARVLPVGMTRPLPAPAEKGPMVSRFRVAGPQIGVNLIDKHFGVEGAGNLLIEDLRIPQSRQRSEASSSALASVGALEAGGPSQTLFQWQNSMSFLNNRNIAVFDHQVVMDHRAGAEMVFSQELLASRKLDPQKLAQIKSRQAHLTCDNLLVEFMRAGSRKADDNTPLSSITQLKTFQATGHALLDMEGGRQSITGSLVSYKDETGDVRVIGSSELPAQVVMEQDERTGKLKMWKGSAIEGNLHAETFRVQGGSVLGTGK